MRHERNQGSFRREDGFTMIELAVAMSVVAVLIGIAVPSFLGMGGRSSLTAAKANLRNAVPAVESYFADHGTYDQGSMTVAALRAYEPSLATGLDVVSGSDSRYCIAATTNGATVFKAGPAAAITATPCS
jgi:prepilin-type N-terminal cleavage/methylation domain-containing protein